MPNRKLDLKGKTFGYLTVIEYAYTRNNSYWRCKCVCGNEITRNAQYLKNTRYFQNCGCVSSKLNKERATIHGDHKTRLYGIWASMKKRCLSKNNCNYPRYGGRGIKVCDEWLDYLTFKKWALSNGYSDDLTIDRIDVNGNYCPENCRWATMKEQQNNRRNNKKITYNNETHTVSEWAEITHISRHTLDFRFNNNWPLEIALTLSTDSKKPMASRI